MLTYEDHEIMRAIAARMGKGPQGWDYYHAIIAWEGQDYHHALSEWLSYHGQRLVPIQYGILAMAGISPANEYELVLRMWALEHHQDALKNQAWENVWDTEQSHFDWMHGQS